MKLNFARRIFAFFLLFLLSLNFIFPPIILAQNSLPTEKQFTGHVFDQSSDLYYMRARYYDPAIGRFLSPDSQGDPTSKGNRYLYVANNPISLVDPSGGQTEAGEPPFEFNPFFYPFFYEEWVYQLFPESLDVYPGVVSPTFITNFPKGWGNLMHLDLKAWLHLARAKAVYDPKLQPEQFRIYLFQDIEKSYPYNEGLKKAWDLQERYRGFLKNQPRGPSHFREITSYYEEMISYYKMKEEEEWQEYFSKTVAERMEELFLCADDVAFFNYAAGRGGDFTMFAYAPEIKHAVPIISAQEGGYRIIPGLGFFSLEDMGRSYGTSISKVGITSIWGVDRNSYWFYVDESWVAAQPPSAP